MQEELTAFLRSAEAHRMARILGEKKREPSLYDVFSVLCENIAYLPFNKVKNEFVRILEKDVDTLSLTDASYRRAVWQKAYSQDESHPLLPLKIDAVYKYKKSLYQKNALYSIRENIRVCDGGVNALVDKMLSEIKAGGGIMVLDLRGARGIRADGFHAEQEYLRFYGGKSFDAVYLSLWLACRILMQDGKIELYFAADNAQRAGEMLDLLSRLHIKTKLVVCLPSEEFTRDLDKICVFCQKKVSLEALFSRETCIDDIKRVLEELPLTAVGYSFLSELDENEYLQMLGKTIWDAGIQLEF